MRERLRERGRERGREREGGREGGRERQIDRQTERERDRRERRRSTCMYRERDKDEKIEWNGKWWLHVEIKWIQKVYEHFFYLHLTHK